MRKEDGSYLKSLQLDPLGEKDAGLYLCLAINRNGYSIEKTYLNVKPSKSITQSSLPVLYYRFSAGQLLMREGLFLKILQL